MRLTGKLISLLVLLSVFSLGVIGYLTYEHSRQTIVQNTQDRLVATTLLKQNEFNRWIGNNIRQLEQIAQRPLVRRYAATLTSVAAAGAEPRAAYDYLLEDHLRPNINPSGGFRELKLLDEDTGLVLVSTEPSLEGQSRSEARYFTVGKSQTTVENAQVSSPANDVKMRMATPISDDDANVLAVLVGHVDFSEMTRIMLQGVELSQSEETYLVNEANLFVTEPRFGEDFAHTATVHSQGVVRCLNGANGTGFYQNYRNQPVIGVYRWMPSQGLCIITEIEQMEAFAPIYELRQRIASTGFIIAIIVVVLGTLFARTITVPVTELLEGAREFGRGNLDYQIAKTSNDELGDLAAAFNTMALQRKKAEVAQMRLTTILEATPDVVSTADLEGNLLFLNKAAHALLNISLSQFMDGIRIQDIHPKWAADVVLYEGIPTAIRTGYWSGETAFRTADGKDIPVSQVILAHRDVDDAVEYLSTIARDITDHKRLEQELRKAHDELERQVRERTAALRENKEILRALLDAIPESAFLIDAAGIVLGANQTVAHRLRVSLEELVGSSIYEHLPADVASKRREHVAEAIDSGKVVRFEDERFGRHIYNLVYPVLDGEKNVTRLAILGVDMTERIETERALRASEERYRTLAESAPDMIFVIDREDRVQYANSFAARQFDGNSAEIIGQPRSKLFPSEIAEHQKLALDHIFETGQSRSAENSIKFPGYEAWLHTRLVPLHDETGTVAAVMGVSRDITARKKMEEELQQKANALARSNAELEQFAYVASHDLQEPLRMVSSYLQLLERRYKNQLDADAREFISYAVDGALRMQCLIKDLLLFSRVGTRGSPFEPVDCNAVIEQVLINLQIAVQESGAQISYDPLPTVMADRSQMGQLLQNLIGNALKFRGNVPPKIHIKAERCADRWRFSVRDNGIGISSEYTDQIFVIFRRLHGRHEYGGTGIGLAICKKIVERHRGRIWVESQPDQGATFLFTLPAQTTTVASE